MYRPIKLFPHQSIKQAITKLAQSPGFVQSCELWHKKVTFAALATCMMCMMGKFEKSIMIS